MAGRFLPLLVWAAGLTSAAVVPFVEPGFFFDFNREREPVPIPVTEQCEKIHIKWDRRNAIGPNPVAPYSLQIYTSTFETPLLLDAGNKLSFDWDVPFAPGTQYQICMFDSNGVPGGCQDIYTVISNSTTEAPRCANVTSPERALRIDGTVLGGPISQYGFYDQCTDISIKPLEGAPPFTLTIAPPLHPPFNLTSNTMDPIVWTVSMSRAMPFFMSMTSSDGLVWANGPMHVGRAMNGPPTCIVPGVMLVKRAQEIAAGAAVGSLFGGIILAVVAFLVYPRALERKRSRQFVELEESKPQPPSPTTQISSPTDIVGPTRPRSSLPPLPVDVQRESSARSQNQIYVMHHDAGRAAVTVTTSPGLDADVVELPPTYMRRDSEEETTSTPSSHPPVWERGRKF